MIIGKRTLMAGKALALVLGGWLGLTAASEAQSLRALPRPLYRQQGYPNLPNVGSGGLLQPLAANPGALQVLPQAGGRNAVGFRGFQDAMWGLSQPGFSTMGGSPWGYANGLMNLGMNPYMGMNMNPYMGMGMNPYMGMNMNPYMGMNMNYMGQGQVVGMSPWQLANPFWQFNGIQNPWNNFSAFNPFLDPNQGLFAGAGLGNGLGNFGGLNNPFLMTGFGNGVGNLGGFTNPFLMPGFGGGLNNNPIPAPLR